MPHKIGRAMEPDPRDYDLVRSARYQWGFSRERYRDGILMRCFNKEEADMLRVLFAKLAPEVPVRFSWMIFKDVAQPPQEHPTP